MAMNDTVLHRYFIVGWQLAIVLSSGMYLLGYKDHAFTAQLALNLTLFAVIVLLVHTLNDAERDRQTKLADKQTEYNAEYNLRVHWMRKYHEVNNELHAVEEKMKELRNHLSVLQGEVTEIEGEPEFLTSVPIDIVRGVPTAPSSFRMHA